MDLNTAQHLWKPSMVWTNYEAETKILEMKENQTQEIYNMETPQEQKLMSINSVRKMRAKKPLTMEAMIAGQTMAAPLKEIKRPTKTDT